MTTLQISCHCGQELRIKSELIGKLCQCPACGRQFRIPKPLDDMQVHDLVDSVKPVTPPRERTASFDIAPSRPNPLMPSRSSNLVTPVVLFVGLWLLVVFMIAGIGWWVFLGGREVHEDTAEVVEQFEPFAELPMPTASQSSDVLGNDRSAKSAIARSEPMLRASQEFIKFAAVPNSSAAVAMIDQQLFDKRVRGPVGSAAAVLNKVTTKKLLSNFCRRSFESTPGNGALRHWKVIGKTKFDGQEAVLVRYYSEVYPPNKWISDDELLISLIPLISVEQYWDTTGKLRMLAPGTSGDFGNRVPQWPDDNGLFFPRAAICCSASKATQAR